MQNSYSKLCRNRGSDCRYLLTPVLLCENGTIHFGSAREQQPGHRTFHSIRRNCCRYDPYYRQFLCNMGSCARYYVQFTCCNIPQRTIKRHYGPYGLRCWCLAPSSSSRGNLRSFEHRSRIRFVCRQRRSSATACSRILPRDGDDQF